jgi:DNA ligase-1
MARSGVMLAKPLEEHLLARWGTNYIVQPKLNGIRCRVKWSFTGKPFLLSSEANEIVSVPHINDQLLHYGKKRLLDKFDGELYCHGMSLQKIRSITGRTVNLHPDHELMNFYMFDVINRSPQRLRTQYLEGLTFKDYSHLSILRSTLAYAFSDVVEDLNTFMEAGYEGIIIRNPNAEYVTKKTNTMLKYKPRKKDCYEIVGTQEEISIHGDPKDALGSFECVKDGEFFNVGTGPLLTKHGRESLWARDDLIGKFLSIKYQNLTDRGVPYVPVAIEIVDRMEEDES